jgi:hypothetical protein
LKDKSFLKIEYCLLIFLDCPIVNLPKLEALGAKNSKKWAIGYSTISPKYSRTKSRAASGFSFFKAVTIATIVSPVGSLSS